MRRSVAAPVGRRPDRRGQTSAHRLRPTGDAVVAGGAHGPRGTLGVPVLADAALAGRACGPYHATRASSAPTTPSCAAAALVADARRRTSILRFGAPPTSKPLATYLQRHRDVRQVRRRASRHLARPGPHCRTTSSTPTRPPGTARDARRAGARRRRSPAWLAAWRDGGRRRARSDPDASDRTKTSRVSEPSAILDLARRRCPRAAPSSPATACRCATSIPSARPATAASASHGQPRRQRHRRRRLDRAGRGGGAATGRVVLVIGDLSFYHDMNGLLAAQALRPQRDHRPGQQRRRRHLLLPAPARRTPEHFETLFGTPHGLDFAPVAQLYGLGLPARDDAGGVPRRAAGLLRRARRPGHRGQDGPRREPARCTSASGATSRRRCSRRRHVTPHRGQRHRAQRRGRRGDGPAAAAAARLHRRRRDLGARSSRLRRRLPHRSASTSSATARSDSPADPARYTHGARRRRPAARCSTSSASSARRCSATRWAAASRCTSRWRRRSALGASSSRAPRPASPTPTERAARVAADDALADSIERDGLEAFVDRWQAQPLFASQLSLPAEVLRAAAARSASRNSPLGLANSLRGMGAGTPGVPAAAPARAQRADAAPRRRAGRALRRAGARRMARRSPARERSRSSPDAGHAAHLEQPDELRHGRVATSSTATADQARQEEMQTA